MSQASMALPTVSPPAVSGPAMFGMVNAALQALASNSKGPSEPSEKYPGMFWLQDNVSPWLLKQWVPSQWVIIGAIDTATFQFTPYLAGEPMTSGKLAMSDTWGCALANNSEYSTRNIDVSAGRRRDDSDTIDIVLAAAISKRIDQSWAAGDGAGGLQSDQSRVANKWYHVYLIIDPATPSVDVLFSRADQTLTLPGGYTKKRRLGSILLNASSNIRNFFQHADRFFWKNGAVDFDLSYMDGTFVSKTLTVPYGVVTRPVCNLYGDNGNPDTPTLTGLAWRPVGSDAASGLAASGLAELLSNTSSQIEFAGFGGKGICVTHGWIDDRGKNF